MRPPADLPPELVLLGEAYAHRADIDPGDWWDYVYRRKPWPPEVRAGLVDAFSPLLTARTENATLATMNASDITPARVGRRQSRPKHPPVAAVKRAALSYAQIAAEVKRSRQSVQSWFYPEKDDAYRPIPRDIANYLKSTHKIPLAVWPRIAD